MNNLYVRILTALVAGTIAIVAVISSVYGFWLFCSVISVAGLWEFLRMVEIERKGLRGIWLGFAVLTWLSLLVEVLPDIDFPLLSTYQLGMILLVFPIAAGYTLFQPPSNSPLQQLALSATGYIYCMLALVLFFRLSYTVPGEYNFRLPLGILLLTWVLDSLAYFVGKYLGKRPLYPQMSPKKTVEGAIGGALFCLGVGGLLMELMPVKTMTGEPVNWWVVALLICVLNQIGDLIESMFKRSVALKDTGSILPGHGGMLDRFDGPFFSLPFIFFYFSLV